MPSKPIAAVRFGEVLACGSACACSSASSVGPRRAGVPRRPTACAFLCATAGEGPSASTAAPTVGLGLTRVLFAFVVVATGDGTTATLVLRATTGPAAGVGADGSARAPDFEAVSGCGGGVGAAGSCEFAGPRSECLGGGSADVTVLSPVAGLLVLTRVSTVGDAVRYGACARASAAVTEVARVL